MRNELFGQDFVWGAASSSFQVEGGAAADLRGQSIWDEFCTVPAAIRDGSNGQVACDHYNRYREDVRLMHGLGLRAYRLSISWPRVLPNGTGRPNETGLDFYDRLIDALLAHQITPWVTLYHWDLPTALDRRGGWGTREIVDWFAEYTDLVAHRLGDRVQHWFTLNEPQIFLGLGLGDGIHAPGRKLPLADRLQAAHHALLAHGRSVQVLRARAPRGCKIGWAPAVRVEYPATDGAADIEAARQTMMSVRSRDLWNNTWFGDPICLGRYPEDGLKIYGADAPQVQPGDMDLIRQPIDFFGANIYSGSPTRAEPDGVPVVMGHPHGHARNALSWPVAPPTLRWGTRFLWERYHLPVYITENGMSNLDWVDLDGQVRDPQRIDYMRRHLLELRRAIGEGVDVRGYFHWSIMDNFEWAEGYKERFGLVFVDFLTQHRTLKSSARWYQTVIATNGAALEWPVDQVLQQRPTRERLPSAMPAIDRPATVGREGTP